MLTVFLSLLMVLPLTLWISSSITNPLGELMHRFAEGAKGDVSVRMKRVADDEVGTLARYFNTFMERLDKSRRNLKTEIEVRKYELENIRRDGQRVWVAWTNKAVRNDAGKVVEYLCIGHNVTEAKAAEKEMGRMRLYLQKIVDSMPSIMVGVDMQERITLFNREAEHITGMTSEEALGQPLNVVFRHFMPYKAMIHQAMAEKATMTRLPRFWSSMTRR